MDALGKSGEVGVKGADDDARVLGHQLVKTDKVFAVQGQKNAAFGYGKGQYFLVGQSTTRPAGLLNGQYVMT